MLVEDSRARLRIDNTLFSNPYETVEGLDGFSHVLLVFVFHANNTNSKLHAKNTKNYSCGSNSSGIGGSIDGIGAALGNRNDDDSCSGNDKPQDSAGLHQRTKVRPPRMDGQQKLGIFACRSPYRFNNIGLTVARLHRIERTHAGAVVLHLRGVDLIDGTPILDIKPYIPDYDAIDNAETAEWFRSMPMEHAPLTVIWTEEALQELSQIKSFRFYESDKEVKSVIEKVLSMDPRSKYRRDKFKTSPFGFAFDVVNVRCTVDDESGVATITSVEDWSRGRPSKETLRARTQEENERYRQSKDAADQSE